MTSLLFHDFYKHFPQAGAHLRSLDGFLVFNGLKDTEVPKSVTFGVRASKVSYSEQIARQNLCHKMFTSSVVCAVEIFRS